MEKKKVTFDQRFRKVMARKKWWKPYEIQREMARKFDKFYSESTITAQLRKMKAQSRPPKSGKGAWEYTIQ